MAGIYVHIPFCATRCAYCDFCSSTDISLKNACINAIIREIEMRRNYLDGEMIDTVYIGGGTPSQLPASDLERIFNTIHKNFNINPDHETTLEVNPDDITREYTNSLASLPINRISMGVQSLDDSELRFLNRRHNSLQARRAIELCRLLYINISIDLIYGIPGQTLPRWERTLAEATSEALPHLSAYHLSFEEGTPMHRLLEKGAIEQIDESLSLDMFNALIDNLSAAGYEHYEISSFARHGYISRHNSSYWTGKKYLGAGPSAHSYNHQSRQWNTPSLPIYIEGMEKSTPEIETEPASGYNEYIMTRLRTTWGIDLAEIKTLFGQYHHDYLLAQAERYIQTGMLKKNEKKIKLTRQALFTSDAVISQLLKVDSYTKQEVSRTNCGETSISSAHFPGKCIAI
jgi:oxygen-independent coproporphyrinogen-3 oxidase